MSSILWIPNLRLAWRVPSVSGLSLEKKDERGSIVTAVWREGVCVVSDEGQAGKCWREECHGELRDHSDICSGSLMPECSMGCKSLMKTSVTSIIRDVEGAGRKDPWSLETLLADR